MPENRDERLDEQLSALHDGELQAGEARELQRRSEDDPAVRERLELFGQLDEQLREMPQRSVPASLSDGLRARIQNEARTIGRVPASRRPRSRAPRRIAPSVVGVGVAAAAALALYLALGTGTPVVESPPTVTAENQAPATTARDPFAGASEEEIAIALHYETLADLRMIEDLEMLELLEVLDSAEPRG